MEICFRDEDQPRFIYRDFEDIESPMMHAKVKDRGLSGSDGVDFTVYDSHVTETILINSCTLPKEDPHTV